jgi:hypothetical protein
MTRIVALLASALLLALTVLAASPELHERLHGMPAGSLASQHHQGHADGTGADDEDGCIVTLFSQGAMIPVALLSLAAVVLARLAPLFAFVDRVVPGSPKYLRQPAQGPPLA